MIIKSVTARNVLKYAELSLENLPASGLIAVSGPNESGKSTIGETVCFALFGRTFSLSENDLRKVIRWGENDCQVNMGFEVNGRGYEISRFLDRDGAHSARLLREGESEPVAKGVERVADAVFDLLGYEYDEFIESFYLAQREITTPHPHSHAVKIMAGVAPLEYISQEFDEAIEDQQDLLAEIETEVEATEADVEELALEEGRLIGLEDERNALEERQRDTDAARNELQSAVATYKDNALQIRAAEGSRGTWSFLRFIVFLLAILAGGAWALLTYSDQLPGAQGLVETVRQGLQSIPQWRPEHLPYLGYAGAALGVLFLILWGVVGAKRGKVRQLREESGVLAQALARTRAIEGEGCELRPAEEVEAEELEEPAVADDEDQEEEPLEPRVEEPELERITEAPERPGDDEYNAIKPLLIDADLPASRAEKFVAEETAWLDHLLDYQQACLDDLDQLINEEMERVQQAARLQEVLDGLNEKRRAAEHRIETREKGMELLQGASRHMSSTFNRDVRELVGRTLPRFTDGRYEHLKIAEDLNVQVFSSEKRDFMELDEISSGTQRQIMLALRLALSEKLLNRAIEGKQFAFLDEPFAFFDEERTRRAINALTSLSEDISQIWIVAQSFPEPAATDPDFAATIVCARDLDVLKYTA